MPTALESRAALAVVSASAADVAQQILASTSGDPVARRLVLLDNVPDLIGYYTDGSSALALDFYQEEREKAGVLLQFAPEAVVTDRTVKIRRGISWASEPLFDEDDLSASLRLAAVVQPEVARSYRDTITGNREKDPAAVGWRRVTAGGCKLCRMLSDRGAVYRESSVNFAAHPNCNCSAQPVFLGGDVGQEASVEQYRASRRGKTPAQRKALSDYLDAFYSV